MDRVPAATFREQHSSIAAGVAKELEEKADGWYVRAHVVDPASVLKVKHGVLKGFSIGIRGARVVRDEKALGGRIVGGTIVEVSLVDRPANPNAKLMLAKADELGKLTAVSIEVPKPSDLFKSDADESCTYQVKPLSLSKSWKLRLTSATAPAEEAPAEEVALKLRLWKPLSRCSPLRTSLTKPLMTRPFGAISDLIVVEAGGMADGSDERDSIKNLLRASKHLYRWYQGEVANGEVANPKPGDRWWRNDDDVDSDSDADAVEAIHAGKSLALDSEQIDGVLVKAIEVAKAACQLGD
jgi:hypothetical protein